MIKGLSISLVLVIVKIIIVITTLKSVSQDKFENYSEHIFSEEINDLDLDLIEELLRNPVRINEGSFAELCNVPGITPAKALQIIAHREKNGSFKSYESIQTVGGFDADVFKIVRPFIALTTTFLDDIDLRQRVQRIIESQSGYSNGAFSGSSYRSYTRISFRARSSFFGGFLIEKDPGERGLLDHKSGFVRWGNRSGNSQIVAGTYNLDFGQGLLFSKNRAFKNSRNPFSGANKIERGARGQNSSVEDRGFLGVAGDYTKKRLSLHAFVANTDRDAILYSDGASLVNGGYHRTNTEISHQNVLNERVAGIRGSFALLRRMIIGFTSGRFQYDHKISSNSSLQAVKDINLWGVDTYFNVGDLTIFGEIAKTGVSGTGLLVGMEKEYENTRILIQGRRYSPDFFSPGGGAYSYRSSGNRNERGLLLAFRMRPFGSFKFNVGADYYQLIMPEQSSPGGQDGAQLILDMEKSFDHSSVVFNWRRKKSYKSSSSLSSAGLERDYFVANFDHRFRIQYNHSLRAGSQLVLRTDIFYAYDDEVSKKSYLATFRYRQDMRRYQMLSVAGTLFSTQDISGYVYEPDLPGVFSVQMLKGKGARFSLKYSIDIALVRFSLKYGIVDYYDRDFIGTGNSLIDRSFKQDMGFQMDIKM